VSVSVVIAARDEAPSVGEVVRGCVAHTPDLGEVLVIDDGSRDGTGARAREAGARVVRLEVNQGKGAALRRGIAEARGEVLVFLDADGQDDPREIPLLLAAMAPGVDLVIGSRFLGTFREGAITPVNRAGNLGLTAAANLLFDMRVTDTQAGFRAVRRRALEGLDLRARAYDIETELLLRVHLAGGRVVEVPVTRSARSHGRSGLSSLRDGARILRCMLRVRWGARAGSADQRERDAPPG